MITYPGDTIVIADVAGPTTTDIHITVQSEGLV